MAIKKGAFELYTQERKLPEKGIKKSVKTSHFFDDTYTKDNGSLSVQEQLTSNESLRVDSLPDHNNFTLNDNTINGSQSAHNRSATNEQSQIANQLEQKNSSLNENTDNGSQLVHDRFTSNEQSQSTNQWEHGNSSLNDNAINGSQLVHDKSTSEREFQVDSLRYHNNFTLNDNTINGSQSDHNRSTTNERSQIVNQLEHKNSSLNENTINGSQLVHVRFTSNEQSQIGNQREHKNSSLNEDLSNDSPLDQEKPFYLASNPCDTQPSEFEKTPLISFAKLVGNQRAIVIALYKNMRINKSDTTDELTLESISKLTHVNQKSLKNTLFRLNNAGVLIRTDQKIGRGGWVKYKINSKIIKEIQQKEFFR